VQGAVRTVIEPIFEREFAEFSYGFRPGRGCKDALAAVWTGLAKEGRQWVVDADIKGYFDTIPHDRLMQRVEERIADSRVLALIRKFLTQGVMEEGKCRESEQGTPQGGVISPLLANIYLNPLDHQIKQHGARMVRYADDFVVLCNSQEEAEAMLSVIRNWMADNALTLHAQQGYPRPLAAQEKRRQAQGQHPRGDQTQ
jgi:RNA-directed DNA polymerase